MEHLPKKILIVEDNADFLLILRASFNSEGFNVFCAANGAEGLKIAQKENPDMVLLDILMPEMSGIEMAKKLKALGIKIPIIFLTNMEEPSSISEALEIGGSDYIVKSDADIKDIIMRVKSRLGVK